MNNAAFGQYTRFITAQVQHLADDLGAETAVICYRQNGVPFTYGRPSFVEVMNRFVNHQAEAEATIVSLHRAIALVQLEGVNQVQRTVLLHRLDVLINEAIERLTTDEA